MPENKKPEYLYNPEKCPCPRGAVKNCPNYRKCDACQANHHNRPQPGYTACERLASKEGYSL